MVEKEEKGQWRTINGKHVFFPDGADEKEVMAKAFGDSSKKPEDKKAKKKKELGLKTDKDIDESEMSDEEYEKEMKKSQEENLRLNSDDKAKDQDLPGDRVAKIGDREMTLNQFMDKFAQSKDRENATDMLLMHASNFNMSENEMNEFLKDNDWDFGKLEPNENYEGVAEDLYSVGFEIKNIDENSGIIEFEGPDTKTWQIKQNENLGFDVYNGDGKMIIEDINANKENVATRILQNEQKEEQLNFKEFDVENDEDKGANVRTLYDEIEDVENDEDVMKIEDKINTAYANDEISEKDHKMLLNKLFDEDNRNKDDYYSPENIIKRGKAITNAFEMPSEDGWVEEQSGEKAFIKNKDTDKEMFIQYNGSDYDGENQEWVAGYMKDGDYITKKFDNMDSAKEFLDNVELNDDTKTQAMRVPEKVISVKPEKQAAYETWPPQNLIQYVKKAKNNSGYSFDNSIFEGKSLEELQMLLDHPDAKTNLVVNTAVRGAINRKMKEQKDIIQKGSPRWEFQNAAIKEDGKALLDAIINKKEGAKIPERFKLSETKTIEEANDEARKLKAKTGAYAIIQGYNYGKGMKFLEKPIAVESEDEIKEYDKSIQNVGSAGADRKKAIDFIIYRGAYDDEN